ncbi:MAG: efflux RND transporter periplasmic adaptor subunit [Planctomycetota bacterium]|jgi:membrane fusion protein (multidrug efflux system)
MRTALVYLIALGAVVAAVMLGFPELFATSAAANANDEGAGENGPAAPPVVVARVVKLPFIDTLEALGTVIANESVMITPNRADHVAAIHFEDGQHVKKGDLLVELNSEEEKALLAEATAVRDDRRINHKRVKELFDQNMASAREFDESKTLVAGAEARVVSLEAAISDRKVRAPFAGVLGLRRVSIGAHVQPATVITTLDDLSVVKLDFTIPETWLPHVQPGMTITAHSDTWPRDEFAGKVATIATRLDPRTRSATVRALLPNKELKLRPGMLLKVTIERGESTVLQVPEEVLITVGEDHFVFRVGGDGIAERVQVSVGRRRVGAVEITAGLGVDDQVVVEGIVRVRHGAPVQVVKIKNLNQKSRKP